MQPLPPSPAVTVMDTSSTNFILLPLMRGWKERPTLQTKKTRRKTGLSGTGLASAGYDTHVAPHELTRDHELDHAVSRGAPSVILAHANVLASVKLGAALTNDDVAGSSLLTTVQFHTKSFGF